MTDFTKIRGTHYRLNGDPVRTARELGWGRRLGLNAARVLAWRASPHPPVAAIRLFAAHLAAMLERSCKD